MQTVTTPTSFTAGTANAIPQDQAAALALAQVKNGAAAAAMIAAGAGGVFFGIFIMLAENIPAVKAMMNLYNPVGPLSGKTIFGLLAWLVSWAVLHFALRNRELAPRNVAIVTFVLIGVSLLLTFPLVYTFGHL